MSALINPRENLSLIVTDFFNANFVKSGFGYHCSRGTLPRFTGEGPIKIIQHGFLFIPSSYEEVVRDTCTGLNIGPGRPGRYKMYKFGETLEQIIRRTSIVHTHYLWQQRVQAATDIPTMGGKYFYSDKDKDKWLVETTAVYFEAVSTYAWLVDRKRVLLTVISNILARRAIEYAQNEEDRFARIVAALETECKDKEL